MRVASLTIVVALMLASMSTSLGAKGGEDDAIVAIVALMRETWERPDAPLSVTPVVVDGDYAIADWTQGDQGGRALLAYREDGWRVVLCAGEGLKDVAVLHEAGLSVEQATRLVAALNEAERAIEPERLQLIASFQGLVSMDETPRESSQGGAHLHGHSGSDHE